MSVGWFKNMVNEVISGITVGAGGVPRNVQFNVGGALAGASTANIATSGELALVPQGDANLALTVTSHSATQSAPLVVIKNNSAVVAQFSVDISGEGVGDLGDGTPSLVTITQNDFNTGALGIKNTHAPANAYGFLSMDNSGNFNVGTYDGTANYPSMVFQNAGVIKIEATGSAAGLNLTGTTATFASLGVILTAAAPTVAAAQVGIGSTHQTTVGAAGAASALPAFPTGYLIINVAGTPFVVPYYAAS